MSRKLERSKKFIIFLDNQNRRAYDRGIIIESNKKKTNYRYNNNSNLNKPKKDRIIESTEMCEKVHRRKHLY